MRNINVIETVFIIPKATRRSIFWSRPKSLNMIGLLALIINFLNHLVFGFDPTKNIILYIFSVELLNCSSVIREVLLKCLVSCCNHCITSCHHAMTFKYHSCTTCKYQCRNGIQLNCTSAGLTPSFAQI